jgi:excisionase family DNA binding protein
MEGNAGTLTVDRLLTTQEVAELYAYAPKTIRKLAHEGTLPAVQLHRRGPMRFRRSDVERLIERREEPDADV